jgi:tRNA-binding EMAP/Myf-like protein
MLHTAVFAVVCAAQVARIVSAEPLENSAKLLRLQADLGGDDTRQVMAGEAEAARHHPHLQTSTAYSHT